MGRCSVSVIFLAATLTISKIISFTLAANGRPALMTVSVPPNSTKYDDDGIVAALFAQNSSKLERNAATSWMDGADPSADTANQNCTVCRSRSKLRDKKLMSVLSARRNTTSQPQILSQKHGRLYPSGKHNATQPRSRKIETFKNHHHDKSSKEEMLQMEESIFSLYNLAEKSHKRNTKEYVNIRRPPTATSTTTQRPSTLQSRGKVKYVPANSPYESELLQFAIYGGRKEPVVERKKAANQLRSNRIEKLEILEVSSSPRFSSTEKIKIWHNRANHLNRNLVSPQTFPVRRFPYVSSSVIRPTTIKTEESPEKLAVTEKPWNAFEFLNESESEKKQVFLRSTNRSELKIPGVAFNIPENATELIPEPPTVVTETEPPPREPTTIRPSTTISPLTSAPTNATSPSPLLIVTTTTTAVTPTISTTTLSPPTTTLVPRASIIPSLVDPQSPLANPVPPLSDPALPWPSSDYSTTTTTSEPMTTSTEMAAISTTTVRTTTEKTTQSSTTRTSLTTTTVSTVATMEAQTTSVLETTTAIANTTEAVTVRALEVTSRPRQLGSTSSPSLKSELKPEAMNFNITLLLLISVSVVPLCAILIYVIRHVMDSNDFKEHFKIDGAGHPISPVVRLEQADSISSINEPSGRYDRSNFIFKSLLGEGNFGQVWKVETQMGVVAVKTERESNGQGDLGSEAEIMRKLGSHPNVVMLLEAYTDHEPFMIVMEYAMRGRLLSLLRAARGGRNSLPLMNTKPAVMPLSPKRLLSFAHDIAKGMEYISSKKIVHCDLAARNVLLDHNGVCKICDFGMSVDLNEIEKKKAPKESLSSWDIVNRTKHRWHQLREKRDRKRPVLPIRWMAPESLLYQIYSIKTDVFSFGIVLWEISTLGCTPYPDFGGREVIRNVPAGTRPEIPSSCQPHIRELMVQCWSKEPGNRPSFTEARQILETDFKWEYDENSDTSTYIDVSGFSEDLEHGMLYFNHRVSELECDI